MSCGITPSVNYHSDGDGAFVSSTPVVVVMVLDGHEVTETQLFQIMLLNSLRTGCLNIVIDVL